MEERKFEPVADGEITNGRKSAFKIIFEEMIMKNVEDLKEHFIEEVIIPNSMDWAYGILDSLLNSIFKNPGVVGSTLPRSYQSSSRKSYDAYYRGPRYNRKNDRYDYDREEDRKANALQYTDISFRTRAEAEKVLSCLYNTMKEYDGIVTIADLCNFSGVDTTWADNTYGWTDLRSAHAYRARDGRFYLELPKPLPIDTMDQN